METLAGLYVVLSIFLVVMAVIWFFLPFAVFGIKGKLDELLKEIKEIRIQVQEITAPRDPDDE